MLTKCLEVNKITSFKKNIYFNLLLLLSALNLNLILRPLKIAAGGINGLSIVIENIARINPSFFIFSFQLIILLLSFFMLEKEKTLAAFYATFVYPFFVFITKDISNIIFISPNDIFVASIFGGIIAGYVSSNICNMNKSPGGIILLSQLLNNKFNLSISVCNFMINIFILSLTFYSMGVSPFIYSLVFLYIYKRVMERSLVK